MRGRLFPGVQGLMALHHRLSEADYAAQARRRADDMEDAMRRAVPSGALGNGRLADASDVAAAGLLDPSGLFIGALNGRMLFYPGGEPIVTYVRTGGGKGRDLILPNLAHVRDRSLIVIDVKDGENAFASAAHREGTLGQPCVFLNPYGILGRPNTRINPLAGLSALAASGERIDSEAVEIAQILLPPKPQASENDWVRQGGQRLLALRMEYLACFEPDMCKLSGLWRFVNSGADDMGMAFAMMSTCGASGIEGRSKALEQTLAHAPKQFEAYKSDAIEALAAFEPDKALGEATDSNEFDFAWLKEKPHTVYLMLPADKIGVAAPWVSMIVNHAIEAIAKARGPVRTTFLLDEFPQLPAAPAILKALRVYREKGVQLWFFSQSRFSLHGRWPKEAIKEFEDQAGLAIFRSVQEPDLIRDVELWSGNRTVLMRGVSHNGGTVETAAANLGESRRTVLQSEDILGLGRAKQILRVAGMPRLVIADCVPFFDVDPWKDQIKDVRKLHRGEAE